MTSVTEWDLLPGRWPRPLACVEVYRRAEPEPRGALRHGLPQTDTSREMESCASCGATLSEDAEWCGQCFAPVRRGPGGRVIGAPAAAAAAPAAPPAGVPVAATAGGAPAAGAPWMRTMNAAASSSKPDTTPEYSRWKAGPTSMGAAGRSIVSVLIVVGLVIGYWMVRGIMVAFLGFDVPGLGFLGMYAALAIPAGAILLVRVWKAQRVN